MNFWRLVNSKISSLVSSTVVDGANNFGGTSVVDFLALDFENYI